MPDGLTTMLSGNCGWGTERCAELLMENSWFFWLLGNYPFALAWTLVMLLVPWRLPADGWLLIAEEYRRHQKRRPARRRRG